MNARKPAPAKVVTPDTESSAKKKISQVDVPAYSLDQALRIPEAIANSYGRKPTAPLKVAQAMELQPNAGPFRMLAGSAIAYGLVTGGAFAPLIELTPLALRILRPTIEGGDVTARREALLKPRVIGAFLRQYDGSPLPKASIAANVLAELGVPEDRTESVLAAIMEGARAVGFIQVIKDKEYVHIQASTLADDPNYPNHSVDEDAIPLDEVPPGDRTLQLPKSDANEDSRAVTKPETNDRVFITHGKNKEFLDPIKRMIVYGKLEPIVSVERTSVSKPVPDKVISEMRSCGSAIIHVDAEKELKDEAGNDHVIINPNVLIEIGAALALYGRRFILLVRDGVPLPSNLQGLYEVRYTGDKLDADTTLKLLEALADVQNHQVPDRYKSET